MALPLHLFYEACIQPVQDFIVVKLFCNITAFCNLYVYPEYFVEVLTFGQENGWGMDKRDTQGAAPPN